MTQIRCTHCGFEKDVDYNIIPDGNVTVKCPQCGKSFIYNKQRQSENFSFTQETNKEFPKSSYHFAGFWIRLLAYIIDNLVILLAIAVLAFLFISINIINPSNIYSIKTNNAVFFRFIIAFMPLFIALFVFGISYYVVGWSKYGKTLGMKIVGIKVINYVGENLTFGNAFLRWLTGYFLPGLIPYISSILYIALAIMIGVDERKQGWHDKISKSFVVYDS